MAIKTFEVTVRIEIETPEKTEPTVADATDIVNFALKDAWNPETGVSVNQVNAYTADEIVDIDCWEVI